jgi:YggT family protein
MSQLLLAPIIIILQAIFGILIWSVVVRFLLQVVRADFYNPVSQFLVKITNPLLRPLRRFIPGYRGIDAASIVLALALQMIEVGILRLITPTGMSGLLILHAVAELLQTAVYVYLFALIIQAIASWINPGGYHPLLGLIRSLTDPLLSRLRRYVPPVAGLDLTPLVALIGLQIVQVSVVAGLHLLALNLG